VFKNKTPPDYLEVQTIEWRESFGSFEKGELARLSLN